MKRYILGCYLLLVGLVSGFLVFELLNGPDMPGLYQDGETGEPTDIQQTPEAIDEETKAILRSMKAVPLPKRRPKPALDLPSAKEPSPSWQQNASVLQPVTQKPKLVIIIDDLGLKRQATDRLSMIEGPYTLAFLPYAEDLPFQTGLVKDAGHELMVHMPMEPAGDIADPGRNAMLLGLSNDEFDRRLLWNLSRFDGFVGVNNHMGSKFTAAGPEMARVMKTLKQQGLVFVDSLTTNKSFGRALAKELQVPFTARDIFLDNVRTPKAIRAQLEKAVRIAEIRGYAIAIGHPYDETLDLLEQLASQRDSLPFELAPLSAIIRSKLAKAGQAG